MAFPFPFSPTLEMIGAFLSRGYGVSRNREPYYLTPGVVFAVPLVIPTVECILFPG